MADKLRVHSLKSTTAAGSGHPTTCMSCAEIMSSLFFSELEKDDEFVLSKGHAAPILWASYAEAGFIPLKELKNLRKIDSNLEGHPTYRMPLIKVATGSLGQGLPAGVGMAIAKRLDKNKGRVYVLLGDGECAEGSVWEAANTAAYYKLNNICAILDVNRLGQSQETMHGHNLLEYKRKFEAFGWNAKIIDGHKIKELLNAFNSAVSSKKPFVIIAKTMKGKGVSFLENKDGWHGKPVNKEQLKQALKEIKHTDIKLKSKVNHRNISNKVKSFQYNKYKKGDLIATRDAFGKALVSLGKKNKNVIVFDGDVKNSTKTGAFFKSFPKRSFESFIAEQNMVGMAAGASKLGFIPFVTTFSTFLTRAYDFIRMAQYSRSNIKIVGSHCGVSIGEDGPSQMGLEDLSMFLSMPESIVIYPCDAVSTEKLVSEMAKVEGVTYMRTTRGKTPVVYNNNEKFPLGSLKVLRKSSKDKALVIGAGETVHEALKAADILAKQGIKIRVIDLYSLKPLDKKSLLKNAKECKNNIITVEDHYFGSIGAVVSEVLGKIKQLYVKELPRSGKPEELRKKYKIDSSAIIKTIKQI